MRTLLAALTAIMLFATPLVAGDFGDEVAAYYSGEYEKAFPLYKSLAEQGHVTAQYNLGLIYGKGRGVPENNVKAYAWWSIAATKGNEDVKSNKCIIMKEMTPTQVVEVQKFAGEF